MVVHAYFNIWCEAKVGWKTFMKRRTAVAKVNSLPFATEAELENHDDVCAICYMEMTQAKVTKCRHFFHSVCLRKWLYIQDTCPLCHAVLYKDLQKSVDNNNEDIVENNRDNSDEEHEDEILDHDDPPYQAPVIVDAIIEQNSSESEDEIQSSSTSTNLTGEDDESIIFDEENDIINLMEHIDQEDESSQEEVDR